MRPAEGRVRPVDELAGRAGVEKVLAEISHELGNYFHKLYYWSEFLQDHRAGGGEDVTATQMLDRTLHGLEAFVREAFGYFHPVELSLVRMPVADIAAAIAHQAGAVLPDVACRRHVSPDAAGLTLAIDPGLLSAVVQTTLRRLAPQVAIDTRLDVVAERVPWPGDGGVAFRFQVAPVPSPAPPAVDGADAVLAGAHATKVMALHGGELLDASPHADGRSIALVLPL